MIFHPTESFADVFSWDRGILPDVSAPSGDAVLFSSVTLYRSIENIPFGENAPLAVRESTADSVLDALEHAYTETGVGTPVFWGLDKLNSAERGVLAERFFTTPRTVSDPVAKFAAVSEALDFSAAVNDGEHITLRAFASGFDTDAISSKLLDFDSALSSRLPYAFDATLGYLNSTPDLLGTGMKVRFLLHLPALSASGGIKVLKDSAHAAGLEFGFFQTSDPAFCTICNSGTLGESETSIIDRTAESVRRILDREYAEREHFSTSERERMADAAARAYGIMKYARLLSERDAFKVFSGFAFGALCGMWSKSTLDGMYSLFHRMRTSHLAVECALDGVTDPLRHRAGIVSGFARAAGEPLE